MRYCPNPACPHRQRTRSAAEFLDHVVVCSDCGAELVEESALAAAQVGWSKAARRPGDGPRPLEGSQRRGGWERAVGVAHRRAQGAIAALIVIAGVRAFGFLAFAWQMSVWDRVAHGETSPSTLELSRSLLHLAAIADLPLTAIAAVMFLRWLSHVLRTAASMSTSPIRWTSNDAVWSFFVPVLNLIRPYQVVRDMHDQLAPSGVPEPAPRPRMDGVGGYRSVAMEKAPQPRDLPHASISAWWGLYILSGILRQIVSFSAELDVAAAVVTLVAGALAVLVVQAIQGRLAERYRRLRHASDEELEEWGLPEPL